MREITLEAQLELAHKDIAELEAENDKYAIALQNLFNCLGPTVPKGLPPGPSAEWHEALRILRGVL
jgi:hypothetical protein